MQQIINLKKFPFCRAVHYFFDLDTFPRVKGHVSYATNDQNALKNTFSKDKLMLNTITYGDVLNRKMFGLPLSSHSNQTIRKENRIKNVCSGYLFDIEDKKHQNDRIIWTLKVILSKLKRNFNVEELKKF